MPRKHEAESADADVSKIDAAHAAKGGDAVLTYSDIQYAREKNADTGAKAITNQLSFYCKLRPEGDELVPQLCYDEHDVSVAVLTVMNEPTVNVSDIHISNPKTNKVWLEFYDRHYSVENNGPGMPVVKRSSDGVWVPFACLFMFRTGSHMKRVKGSIAGGTHGKGVKLTIAHSKSGTVRTTDDAKTFECSFAPMENIDTPTIRKKKRGECGTKIAVELSEKYFEMKKSELQEQIALHGQTLAAFLGVSMGKKSQVYATTARDEPSRRVRATCMRDLVRASDDELVCTQATCTQRICGGADCAKNCTGAGACGEDFVHKWEIVFEPPSERLRDADEPPRGARLSLVNGTCTVRGSNFDKVIELVHDHIVKKGKKNPLWSSVKWEPDRRQIRDLLGIYMNCRIPDAGWNEQVKTHLVSPASRSLDLKIPQKALNELYDRLEPYLSAKVKGTKESKKDKDKALARLEDKTKFVIAGMLQRGGHKKKSVRERAFLFVVEGDSAQTLIKRLLTDATKWRDPRFTGETCSTYNLGGVITNVAKNLKTGADGGVIMTGALKKNPKIRPLIELVQSGVYQGGYVLATDMDIDGGYICCLVLELIRQFDPAAFEERRVLLFATPQARYTPKSKKLDPIEFYSGETVERAERGECDLPPGGRWAYFKGLAALPPQKDKLIQRNLADRLHVIYPRDLERFKELQRVYFSAKPEERRAQLSEDPPEEPRARYERALANIRKKGTVRAEDFVECVMYEYSYATIVRHMITASDGFTESMRKIFYGLPFVKVPKNGDYPKIYMGAGTIGSEANYLHGNDSLAETIRQSGAFYPGSMTTIVFTRLDGSGPTRTNGKTDAGSIRYVGMSPNMDLITTMANPADLVFLERDEMFNQKWEPKRYCPIIPYAVCVNNTGLMHGWTQKTFARCPVAVCDAVLTMIGGGKRPECPELPPALYGFKGKHRAELVEVKNEHGEPTMVRADVTEGAYHYDDDLEALVITEIPVYDSTGPVLTKQMLKGFEKTCSDRWELDISADNPQNICIRILMSRSDYEAIPDVVSFFGLSGTHTPSHLNYLDDDNRVKWYPSYEAVAEAWFARRKKMYRWRLDREQALAEIGLVLEENKLRYCEELESLGIRNGMSVEKMCKILRKHNFTECDPKLLQQERGAHAEYKNPAELRELFFGEKASYHYLLKISAYDRTDKVLEGRRKKIAELRRAIAELDSDRKPFRGANSWRREVERLRELIVEGQRTMFQYEDADKSDAEDDDESDDAADSE